jgi:hypothetical protein
MNQLTRIAYELLQEHKIAYLTPDNTTIDRRRGEADELFINHGTARALVRQGLAERYQESEHPKLRLIA